MKRKLILLLLIAIMILIPSMYVSSDTETDLFRIDRKHISFDLDSMKNVNAGSREADIRIGFKDDSCYLLGVNGSTLKDMGIIAFLGTKAPATGYTADRVKASLNHIYVVRHGSSFALIKVTHCNEDDGAVEFMARQAEAEGQLKLYYMNRNKVRFDFEAMQNVGKTEDSDLYFRYASTAIAGENGVAIKDLGIVDYEKAVAPGSGYSTESITVVKDHVYAIKCSTGKVYILKATNVNTENEFEFITRAAEPIATLNQK